MEIKQQVRINIMRSLLGIGLGLSLFSDVSAQNNWASEVLEYAFGTSQTFGQDSAYFPANVLGPVSEVVGPMSPAGTPEEVVSLGKGGYIVLGFESPILNQAGPDFTVFENVFIFPGGIFDEWMIVSVSPNGVDWTDFPYDSLTGEGLAGRTPTAAIGVNYADPLESGGDSFDLDVVGVDTVRYIRVTDATHFQGPDRLSADLDGIISLNNTLTGISPQLPIGFEAERSGDQWAFRAMRPTQLQLISLNGQVVSQEFLSAGHTHHTMTHQLPKGCYIWTLKDRQGQYAYKWVR